MKKQLESISFDECSHTEQDGKKQKPTSIRISELEGGAGGREVSEGQRQPAALCSTLAKRGVYRGRGEKQAVGDVRRTGGSPAGSGPRQKNGGERYDSESYKDLKEQQRRFQKSHHPSRVRGTPHLKHACCKLLSSPRVRARASGRHGNSILLLSLSLSSPSPSHVTLGAINGLKQEEDEPQTQAQEFSRLSLSLQLFIQMAKQQRNRDAGKPAPPQPVLSQNSACQEASVGGSSSKPQQDSRRAEAVFLHMAPTGFLSVQVQKHLSRHCAAQRGSLRRQTNPKTPHMHAMEPPSLNDKVLRHLFLVPHMQFAAPGKERARPATMRSLQSPGLKTTLEQLYESSRERPGPVPARSQISSVPQGRAQQAMSPYLLRS
ncbi:hypothetical protein P4O66_013486 [Electrophorus voltai]|uniref:Uncharacterized protein n=1 Tax=Electrophorus voltai TaxID=2609070 RepID=A0AAD8Z1V1_9TELE|nr:hypothetical protein P4O66_013486 [Electrophorus voltai]